MFTDTTPRDTDPDFTPCPYCGERTFETFSERLATISPDGNGYQVRHFTARRVGDGAPLGSVECEAGRSGWGAR